MIENALFLGLTGLFLLAAACAPGAEPGATSKPDPERTGPPKAMTIALQREPTQEVGSIPGDQASYFLHRHLVAHDNVGNPLPTLAAELPAQDRGTWVVSPDGTMTTTYRLRPNVTWHDGQPLSPQDFVFAWRVSRDRELPIGARPIAAQITGVDALDDLTLVLRWGAPNPLADRISSTDLGPYPAHLLRQLSPPSIA